MFRRGLYVCAGALVVALALIIAPTPGGGARRPAPRPNPAFTLASVDRCFLAPPPGSTSWPLVPVGRVHGIRGSFNEPRGRSVHFGVDVEALVDRASVYSIASGFVSGMNARAAHFSIKMIGRSHFIQYWHVVPLGSLHYGMRVRVGELIGHVLKGYYQVHVSEFYGTCGWIDPMRPGGPLYIKADTERPEIGALHPFVSNRMAFRQFDTGNDPAHQTDRSSPLLLTDLHGVVDMRAEICDWPDRTMAERPQMDLEPGAIRAYLAPRFNPTEHIGAIRHVYDGATLLMPQRLGTTLWHIWAFGTWRRNACYFESGPNWRKHCGAAYVWHVGGVSGLDTTRYRNGRYQYCVQALSISGRPNTRCTPVVIDN